MVLLFLRVFLSFLRKEREYLRQYRTEKVPKTAECDIMNLCAERNYEKKRTKILYNAVHVKERKSL